MAPMKLLARSTTNDALSLHKVGALPTTILVVFILLSLSYLSVALRCWTRVKLVKNFGWDDVTMLMTLLFFSVYCAVMIYNVKLVGGRTILVGSDLQAANRDLFVLDAFYVLSVMTLKISLALFFLRIVVKPWQRRIVLCIAPLSTIVNVAYFFVLLLQCGLPLTVENFILKKISGKCIAPLLLLAFTYFHGATGAFVDLMFAILPLFILRNTSMKATDKIPLCFILALGATGGIASVARFQYIPAVIDIKPSFFVSAQSLGIWSAAEPGIGIIAGSLATLRRLIDLTIAKLSPRSSGTGAAKIVGDPTPRVFPFRLAPTR